MPGDAKDGPAYGPLSKLVWASELGTLLCFSSELTADLIRRKPLTFDLWFFSICDLWFFFDLRFVFSPFTDSSSDQNLDGSKKSTDVTSILRVCESVSWMIITFLFKLLSMGYPPLSLLTCPWFLVLCINRIRPWARCRPASGPRLFRPLPAPRITPPPVFSSPLYPNLVWDSATSNGIPPRIKLNRASRGSWEPWRFCRLVVVFLGVDNTGTNLFLSPIYLFFSPIYSCIIVSIAIFLHDVEKDLGNFDWSFLSLSVKMFPRLGSASTWLIDSLGSVSLMDVSFWATFIPFKLGS